MKKYLFALLAILLCLSACSAPVADKPGATETNPTASSVPETTPTEPEETAYIGPGYFPIQKEPAEFIFQSGAGGWRCVLSINRDGTFTGQYTDSEMGAIGDSYPRGTLIVCDFSGIFAEIEKINAYTYRAELFDVTTSQTPGEEWIENEIRYVAANPAGIYNEETKQLCESFIIYLPDTPISEVPEAFLNWWPYRGEQKTTLSCYGILNVATNDGFFYTE
jgi:hypothetical protein